MGAGVPEESYFTYNCIYNSKEFNRDMHVKVQIIRHSGVGGNYHNRVAYSGIKNVVRISRTMIIHASLRWSDASGKSLWTMDMSHAVNLHNHTPHISRCMSPEEVWKGSKYPHSDLHNTNPWGCPAYVLEQILQDGNKLPKCMPRSRKGQYL